MKIILPLEVAPIEQDGFHLFVKGRINGRKARFLIDTGASRSVADQNRIHAFFPDGEITMKKVDVPSVGLGTDNMPSNIVRVRAISFGRLKMNDLDIVALDLSHVNQSFGVLKMKKIDAVIGGDLLHHLNAVIDYRHSTITLEKKRN